MILKAALLAGLALMLYGKISAGTLSFYINQRFVWLVFVAVLILAVLALTMVYRLIESGGARGRGTGERGSGGAEEQRSGIAHMDVDDHDRARDTWDVHGHEFDHDHDHDHDHEHEHEHEHGHAGHSHGLSWGAVGLVAVPVVLGLLVPARPLGASAISSRGIGLSAPGSAGGNTTVAQRVSIGPKNILDWLREFSRQADPNAFAGQEVDLVGFVYRDPRNTADQFWVSRFTISCCVADATAIGLLVQTDQAASLKNDSWVRVTGKIGVGEFAGEKLPIILPDKIEPTEQPEHPYLYP